MIKNILAVIDNMISIIQELSINYINKLSGNPLRKELLSKKSELLKRKRTYSLSGANAFAKNLLDKDLRSVKWELKNQKKK